MERRWILTCMLAGAISLSFGQFKTAFGPVSTDHPYASHIVGHDDGSWTLRCGYSPQRMKLLHLDQYGYFVWAKEYNSLELWSISQLLSAADGPSNSTVVVFSDTLVSVGPGLSRRSFGLAGISSDGSMLWAKRHHYDVPEDLVSITDRAQVAVSDDGSIYLDSGEPSRPAIFHLSNTGTTLWAKALNDPDGVKHMVDLVADGNDGCYFLGGYGSLWADTSNMILGRISSTGSLSWSRKILTATEGLFLEPLKLTRTIDGNLLITARSYGPFYGTYTMLISVSTEGEILWAKEYRHNDDENLEPYNTHQNSDGQIWIDFQASGYGYGFLLLGPSGQVLNAYRFPWHSEGNTTYVIGWEETEIAGDRLGVTGGYYVDHEWTTNDPQSEFLWSLDMSDPWLCWPSTMNVTDSVIPLSGLQITSTTTLADYSIGTDPMTLVGTDIPPPPMIDFCSVLVGQDELKEPLASVSVTPNVIQAGSEFNFTTALPIKVEVYGAGNGSVKLLGTRLPQGTTMIRTNGWSPGLYVITTLDDRGRRQAFKLVLQ